MITNPIVLDLYQNYVMTLILQMSHWSVMIKSSFQLTRSSSHPAAAYSSSSWQVTLMEIHFYFLVESVQSTLDTSWTSFTMEKSTSIKNIWIASLIVLRNRRAARRQPGLSWKFKSFLSKWTPCRRKNWSGAWGTKVSSARRKRFSGKNYELPNIFKKAVLPNKFQHCWKDWCQFYDSWRNWRKKERALPENWWNLELFSMWLQQQRPLQYKETHWNSHWWAVIHLYILRQGIQVKTMLR